MDITLAAAVPHQPDPPRFTLERAESAHDLDTVVPEEAIADGGVVDTVRDHNAGEHGQAVFGIAEQLEPEVREPVLQEVSAPLVAGEPLLETLLLDQA